MSLTYKKAVDAIEKLSPVFGKFAFSKTGERKISSMGVGIDDPKKSNEFDEKLSKLTTEELHSQELYAVVFRDNGGLSNEKKEEIVDECSKLLKRKLNKTDIRFE